MGHLLSFRTELCHLCSQPFIPDVDAIDGLCRHCQAELRSSCELLLVSHVDVGIPVLAVTVYEGPVVRLLEAVKRRGHHRPLRFVARELLPIALDRTIGPLYPVPASRRGRRTRGFDQMLVAARHTGREYQSVFARSRGRQQKLLNRELRLRNAVDTLALPSRRGREIPPGIVIDDVLTTGATVARAVSLLRESGSMPTAVVVVAAAL